MGSQDLMSINTVAAKLGLSVHQLRRWELMFGLDIKRGRGQQRQYRPEDLTVLERIKELVEQGWPTSQIRPQIEAEGLITPRLIGVPQQPGNPEVVLESIIGFRNFAERRFIELSKQIDELRQLVISITLKQELAGESDSPWKPVQEAEEEKVETDTEPVEPPPERPVEEITLGPQVAVSTDMKAPAAAAQEPATSQPESVLIPAGSTTEDPPPVPEESKVDASSEPEPPSDASSSVEEAEAPAEEEQATDAAPASALPAQPAAAPAAPAATATGAYHIDEVTDQNYLTVLGKALDIIGWTDEQADDFSEKTFQVPHWDELGRSHAEKMVAHIKSLLNPDANQGAEQEDSKEENAAQKAVEELSPAAPDASDSDTDSEPEPDPDPATAPAPAPVVDETAPAPAPAPEADGSSSETGALPQPIIKPLTQPDTAESVDMEPQTPPPGGDPDAEGAGPEQSFSP